MTEPPRRRSILGGPDSASARPQLGPQLGPRTPADLDEVVREFAGRVARLERELADLRGLIEELNEPVGGAPAEIR